MKSSRRAGNLCSGEGRMREESFVENGGLRGGAVGAAFTAGGRMSPSGEGAPFPSPPSQHRAASKPHGLPSSTPNSLSCASHPDCCSDDSLSPVTAPGVCVWHHAWHLPAGGRGGGLRTGVGYAPLSPGPQVPRPTPRSGCSRGCPAQPWAQGNTETCHCRAGCGLQGGKKSPDVRC